MSLTYHWPTRSRVVTSGFDDPRPYGPHSAADIAGAVGDPVLPLASGQAIYAGLAGDCGLTVWVRHATSSRSHYCHLSRIFVQEGDPVGRESAIGAIGQSGVVTGPHLHLVLLLPGPPPRGRSRYVAWVHMWAVDPLDYLTEEDAMPEIIPPPEPYTRNDYPQPEFGATFPGWTPTQHIHYLYQILRRREIRIRDLEKRVNALEARR